jgi:type 1 glutamine amidotransferase
MKLKPIITGLMAVLIASSALAAKQRKPLPPPTAEEVKKIEEALPSVAPVTPSKDRKVLIFSRCEGFRHKSIPIGIKTMELLGEKTGAYASEQSTELSAFTPENLARFDAVLFLSTTKLDPLPEQKKALLDFARSGKGIIGLHAAADNFYKWEEGAAMMGGLFCGHPWTKNCTVAVKLDEPDHPINACFEGKGFKIMDEIYQFKDPYSREKQRVLTSLDMSDPDTKAVQGGKPINIVRTDNDFGITWIKREGQGRVFYCSLGHNNEIYWNPNVLEHYLAGIQYALGDYDVPDEIK